MRNILFISLYIVVFCACKHSHNNEPPAPQDNRPGGKIILPAGSSINPASLSVLSSSEVSKVSDGEYKMDSVSFENYTTQVVLNANGEALMMRYSYPGNENGDISAQSTATALLMNMPAVQSLTDAAKLSLIKNIASTPDFADLVSLISQNLMSGRALLDSTNQQLLNAFTRLAITASHLRRDGVFEQPILIHKAGNSVAFTNNGVAVYYWVGIYKDGKKITSFPIEAAKLISSSPQDFAMDAVDLVGDPSSATYQLTGDGEYQIYIRSGRLQDNLSESTLALTQNLSFAILDLIKTAVKSDCHAAVVGVLKAHIEGVANMYVIGETSPNDFQGLLVQILKTTYSTIDFKECAASDGAASAARQLLKIFVGYLDFVQKVGDIMNLSISAIHFVGAEAALDTCFRVTAGTATTCVQNDNFALGSYSGYAMWTGYETPGIDVKVAMSLHIASVDSTHKIDGSLRIDIHTSRVYGYINVNSIQFEWGPPDAPFSYTGRFSIDKKTIEGQGGAGNYYAPRNANGPFKLERVP